MLLQTWCATVCNDKETWEGFNIFSWQQKKGLVAEVALMLQANGRVKWRKITRPSQDLMYDSAVLQAIDEAQPFPVPEDKSLIADEIRINFKP